MLYRLYFIGKKVVLFRRFFHCCRVLYFVLPGYCFAPPVKSSTFARNENVFCMNKIGAVLCICVLLLSGCGGKDNEFVVEGTINNLGGRPIYAVYSLENGIVVDTLRPQNGFITFKNSASAVIPIQFYYFDKTPLTKIYVHQENKELLQSWSAERNISASGMRTRRYEQLSKELQGVVAKYVGEHKDSPVSAILLDDYVLGRASDAFCDSLIGLLDDRVLSAPPATALEMYRQFETIQKSDTVLPYLSLTTVADTTELLNPREAQATLLCFWAAETPGTQRYSGFLREIAERYDSLVQVVEISLDRDSAVWKERIESDSAVWARRWAKGGYLYPGVKELHIQSIPYLLVADSLGRIVARGLSPDSSRVYIERLVTP